jgi:hypothetical protein
VVVRWDQAALQGIRDSTLGPPMAARALAILHTCVYDAWAAYDPVAVGTRLGGALRRPAAERTGATKEQAISFAAYRAAVDLFPADRARFDALLAELGYDPADTTTLPTPACPPASATWPARRCSTSATTTAPTSSATCTPAPTPTPPATCR